MIKPTKKFPKFKLENAQAMLEFALVFPIVLLITYGLIEFGRMIFIYSAVTSSAREGARYGAAAGKVDGIPQFAYCSKIRDAVRRTAFLITIPDNKIWISYDNGPGLGSVAPTCEALNPSNIDLGDRIIVKVIAHYEPMIGRFLGVGGFDITIENARTILVNIISNLNPYTHLHFYHY
jgi:hypothetical protein